MGCLCSIWNSNGISHWQRNKAAEIKAAGVRVVIVAVMLLMSMAGPPVTGRWLLYRKRSRRAKHSAPFGQSPWCTSTAQEETDCDTEPVWFKLSFHHCMIDSDTILPNMLPPIKTPPTAHLDHLRDGCPPSNQPCLRILIKTPRMGPYGVHIL